MGTHYSQLNVERRIFIEVFRRNGASVAAIATAIKCHRTTVWRELRRGRHDGSSPYIAHFGQLYCERSRRRAGLARRKLGPDLSSPAWQHLRSGLAARRSPQEIAGRLRLECIIPGSHLRDARYLSHETIYCAIYAMPRGTLRSELVSQLTRSRQGRRPRSRSARAPKLQEMTPIALRPPQVAARIVPGHWEGDLIKGAGGLSAIGTLVERTSRYVMLARMDGLSAQHILDGFTRRLRTIPATLRKTLTYDQGSEMALHKTLQKQLRMQVFFCDAYKPWQRGSNENANGIIREFLPKGIDLAPFTDDDLRKVEFIINNTPRKILGFYTPDEVFSRIKLELVAGVALQA